jgi:hypothetical protein
MKKRILGFFGLCLLFCLHGLFAQTEKKVYTTRKVNPHPPVIDGFMNDDVWERVEWQGDFTQQRPYDGDPPSQQTAFKILYDDANLYVFIRAYDTEPDKIARIMSRRDYFSGDMVEINIDSDFDQQTAFSFTAMASGVKGEEAVCEDGNNWDSSWNPVWYLATSMDDEGWNAEMKIPFSQLRFGNKEEHVWGLQVMRHLFRKEERSHWQYIPQDAPGLVHLFGELHGIRDIKPRHQVEIVPYTVAKTQRFQKEVGNPFADGSLSSLSGGLDGKIGITNDLTLDLTVNPDFGQVEADPSVVNLTAFETYFTEQRPFFVEGKNIFDFRATDVIVINRFNSDNLFYSRRIGRSPQHEPDIEDDAYMDMPEATNILGAFKLSGKTKDGLSIGILESVTAEEKADIDYLGQRRQESVEPLTNYFVGRLQKDFDKGSTILGGMVTAVNRNITNPNMNYLHRAAYTGGFDFSHKWKDRTYYIGVKGMFSHVRGDKEAILETQTSSARYFQRPDADHVSVDSNRTSLSGYGGTVKFGKRGNGRIVFESSFTLRSPGFEINDAGYMRYADIINHGSWMGYYIRSPFSIFRCVYTNFNYWVHWNFAGELLSQHQNINFAMQFKNYWWLNGSFTHNGQTLSPDMLRGGPSFILPGNWSGQLNIESDTRQKFYFYFGGYYRKGEDASSSTQSYWCGGTLRPTDALTFSVYPSYDIEENTLQYITTEELDEDTRYIFSRIDQKTVSVTLRLNYSITPDLSIQYYGQPFVSAGKYANIKRITDPQAAAYRDRYCTFTGQEIAFDADENVYNLDENNDRAVDYSIDNPDFNFRQFRSNLVVRWEYSPGSTLYFVWSQSRTSDVADGRFAYGQDMRDLFRVHPHNIILLKFNHWFSL